MDLRQAVLLGAAAFIAAGHAATPAPSAYAGQETRDIKALSADDVQSLLSGKGMGFAKAAELNGYPGPAHVLELAAELRLTDEQRKRTEALFASMESKAIAVGRRLVHEERKLDRLFVDRIATPELLSQAVGRIGALQAELRAVHLEAHLAQVRILTPQQTAKYVELRGYEAPQGAPAHGGQHKH